MKKKKEEFLGNLWKNKKKIFWGVVTVYIAFIFITAIIQSVAFALDSKLVFIPLEGMIMIDGETDMFSSGVSSSSVVEMIEQAAEDETVKAIVIEINSPGGTVVASKEIADALAEVEKPTIALIREVGASGAYWVASAADMIFVDDLSITGSVGVVSSYLQFSNFLDDYNITYEEMSAGYYKEAGSMFRELSEDERVYLQEKIDGIYEFFVGEVAFNRNISYESALELADGKFYLGYEALEVGLVDSIGNKKDVVSYVEGLTGYEDLLEVVYSPNKGFFESLFGVMGDMSYGVGRGIGSYLYAQDDFEIKVM